MNTRIAPSPSYPTIHNVLRPTVWSYCNSSRTILLTDFHSTINQQILWSHRINRRATANRSTSRNCPHALRRIGIGYTVEGVLLPYCWTSWKINVRHSQLPDSLYESHNLTS